jgi:hypothetical protein
MTVEVVGTTVSAPVDDRGNFQLRDVPSGDRQLRFVGRGADARVEISTVRPGEAITITVTVSGARAVVLSIQRTAADEAELFGTIDAIDAGTRTVSVSGRTVQVSATTVIQRNGQTAAFEALRIGDQIEAKGTVQGSVLIAVRIEVRIAADPAPPAAAEVEFTGVISALDPANRSLVVAGRRVLTNGSTLIRRRGDPVGFDALRVGQRVEVKGVAQPDGAVLASRITIEEEPPQAEVEFTGVISALDPANRSLVVAGRRVLTNGSTLIRRRGDPVGFDALRVGQRVEVKGVAQPDGAVLASRITIED